MHKFCCIFFLIIVNVLSAQEFISTVKVNAEQTGQPNLSVFRTLETSLQEFINNTKWTNTEYKLQERISCSFFINVLAYDNNNSFEASLQVQASRPVFNSGYSTTIANFNDKEFNFRYQEYEPLVYNENSDGGNLISVISYYLFTVLATEADTFKELGGTEFYKKAKQIVNIGQSSGAAGWSSSSGTQSRFRWNDDMISGIFTNYRKALYVYHFEGLDQMSEDQKQAKKSIIESIKMFKEVNNKRPNSYVFRTFFDAKSNEISKVLSGGPKVDSAKTIELLRTLAPLYSKDWDAITY